MIVQYFYCYIVNSFAFTRIPFPCLAVCLREYLRKLAYDAIVPPLFMHLYFLLLFFFILFSDISCFVAFQQTYSLNCLCWFIGTKHKLFHITATVVMLHCVFPAIFSLTFLNCISLLFDRVYFHLHRQSYSK
jgi:hypothetical protein